MSWIQSAIRNIVAPAIAAAVKPLADRVTALEARSMTDAERVQLSATVTMMADLEAAAGDQSVTVTDVP